MGDANQYLNQIPGIAHQGYDSYINQGRDASGRTKGAYEGMMDDPTGFINKIMQQYQTSEGYGVARDKLTKEMGNTAASGGVAGTPMDQANQAEGVHGLLSQDMQQFLQNALGRYDKGLEGEEGIATRGYDASGRLTDALGGAMNQQGGLAFQNAQQNQKNRNGMWGMFGKALGAGAGSFFGPIGTAAGAALGNKWFGGN